MLLNSRDDEFVYVLVERVTQNKKGTATMSFVYDAAGNRSQRTDYNGAITNYSYDALNRLTTISYPDTTSATYGYDVLSRLTTATNPTGTVTDLLPENWPRIRYDFGRFKGGGRWRRESSVKRRSSPP
jgi:YD repeat-containing protein